MVVVVTGGGRGIGAATCLALVERGADVCVGYARDSGSALAVVEECRGRGRRAIAVQADVSVEEEVEALFRTVDEELGVLTGLVNNAGIVAPKARVGDMSAARVSRMMAVNVTGTFLCSREAVRRMSTSVGGAGGAVVNISSAASRLGSPGEYVDYAASKAAVDTLTIGLAREVAAEGIRVNAIRPGLIDTTIHASGGQPDRAERLRHLVPAQRVGDPGEVASVAAWLCTEAPHYLTGAVIDVSGGR
jgi:NAD(P)-dependent dehydrogenase (short-subunit alcohol dehydrogenase family)